MLNLTTFVHIIDPETIEKIWEVKNSMVDFVNHYEKRAKEYGFLHPYFENDYSGGFLFRKRYVGMVGPAEDAENLKSKFKVVKKGCGTKGCYIYEARKSNKQFYDIWSHRVHLNKYNEAHMNGLIPLIFSEVEKEPIMHGDRVAYYGNPISEVRWNSIDGGVLVVLSWFGRNKEEYILNPKHKVIARSEWYRQKGE